MIGADRLPLSPTMMQQQPDSAADGIEFYEYTTDQLDSECAATQSRLRAVCGHYVVLQL